VNIADIRQSLRDARSLLAQEYQSHPNPGRYLQAHSRLVDEHLKKVWALLDMPDSLALLAVGGYGRGELYPRSDIDLLILLPHGEQEKHEQKLQSLVSTLWDIGLEVGHSIRTIEECLQESSDITVQTNLLESRLIVGDSGLATSLGTRLASHLFPRDFFLAKQQEQERRHARYLDASYNLEPNLKESPGGLRDLQTILWISRASGLGSHWRQLAVNGLISAGEAAALGRNERLLQDLRIRLHYLSGRHEDRLLFEHQASLAAQLGIETPHSRQASEKLMLRYYRNRRAIEQMSSILLQALRQKLFPEAQQPEPLNARFAVRDKLLEARDPLLFEQEPEAILESVLLLARHPELTDFSAPTLRALWRARLRIDAAFRRSPQNHARFLDILRQPRGVLHSLRRMHLLGLLGRYIPAFGRISGLMQHDLFHIHTVDEHTLMVLRNLRRFALPEHAHELPLCSRLMQDFARPEVLYIAALFHDIAKGRGGDHSKLGKKDAERFCRQHGLAREDRELVTWLVENHLVMSSTAQQQDLSDQDVIAAFAARARNDRHLVALYLLTVADIRGTSPKVWNAWKGKLLEDLLWAARRYLAGGRIADQAGEIRRLATEQLQLYAIAPEVYRLLWAQLDSRYFLRHEPHEICWHTRLLAHRVNHPTPIVKARLSRIGEGIQVMVYCPDRPYLFACICAFFARMNYNIMEARIYTTQHGYALDSFLVMDASETKQVYRDLMSYIEHELAQQLLKTEPPALPSSGRLSRQSRQFPITPEVSLRQDDHGGHILSIVAGDRPGLLARITLTLSRHGIEVRHAKVNTLGGRAEDTFWLSDRKPLTQPEQETLRAELLQQLK
jgi:[protein-PII] uridylyltransferase